MPCACANEPSLCWGCVLCNDGCRSDQSKEFIRSTDLLPDGIMTHTVAAVMSGFVATFFSTPAGECRTYFLCFLTDCTWDKALHSMPLTSGKLGSRWQLRGYLVIASPCCSAHWKPAMHVNNARTGRFCFSGGEELTARLSSLLCSDCGRKNG